MSKQTPLVSVRPLVKMLLSECKYEFLVFGLSHLAPAAPELTWSKPDDHVLWHDLGMFKRVSWASVE